MVKYYVVGSSLYKQEDGQERYSNAKYFVSLEKAKKEAELNARNDYEFALELLEMDFEKLAKLN
jgi:hypothetical protein